MWWWIAAFVVSLVATYFLMPKPEIAEVPEVQEVDIPTVEDGKTIPVLFGTRNTESFNVVWWGNVRTREFKVSGGDSTWYRDVEDVHGGYRYFLGLHAVLFHGPIDYITMVKSDDKMAWAGESSGGIICDIGETDLYGDTDAEGGFGGYGFNWDDGGGDWPSDGCLEILMGHPDQARNWYLEHNLDGGDAVGDFGAHEIPAFRGVVSAVFNRFYIGNSPQLRKILFRGQRIHTRQNGIAQWYDEKAECGTRGCQFIEGSPIDVAIYISLDFSGSMAYVSSSGGNGKTKFINQRDAVLGFLQSLEAWKANGDIENLSLMLVGFGTEPNIRVSNGPYHNATVTDIQTAYAWLASYSVTPNYWTYWPAGLVDMATFFDGTSIKLRHLMFTTDGQPTTSDGSQLEQTITDITKAQIDAIPNLIANIINIDDFDIRYTAQLDNSGGVDYVTGGDPAALTALLEGYLSLDGELPAIDMNGAHIIRECLTDPDWGMGVAETSIEDTAFMYAADLLVEENLGISIKWTNQTSIDDFIDLIKKHINAELYTDHSSGKHVLKLIRDDYDPDTLLVLGEDDIVKVDNAKRPLIGELVNSVTVQYWDSCSGKDSSVTVQDQALVQAQGGTINTTIQYPGFTNRTTASKAATRDLRVLSSQLLSCTLYVKRTAEELNLGSVFTLYWPDLEISGIVMRVQGIDFGDGKSNTIKLDVIEDVFGLPATLQVSDDESSDPEWTNPTQPPSALVYQLAVEAPYYELIQKFGQNTIDEGLTSIPSMGYVVAGGIRTGNAINAIMATDSGSGYSDAATLYFGGLATLASAVDKKETVWTYDSSADIGLFVIGGHAQIDDELVRIDAVDTTLNTITVGRGTIDTVPSEHAAGAALLAWDYNQGIDNKNYTDSDDVGVFLKPVTGYGTLQTWEATEMVVSLDSRAIRPYPPANLKIDNLAYPSNYEKLSSSIGLSWWGRNRISQSDGDLLSHVDSSIAAEAGVTYTVEVLDDGNAVISETGISTLSAIIDLEILSNGITYEATVKAVRDGYTSWQSPRAAFLFNGAAEAFLFEHIILNNAAIGGLDEWVSEVGTMTTRTDLVEPVGGIVFYGSTSDAESQSSQEIDIVANGVSTTDIDAGDVYITVAWQQGSYAAADKGACGFRFLNSGGGTISTSEADSLASTVAFTWRYFTAAVPANTRKLDVFMHSTRVSGTALNAYYDTIMLHTHAALPAATELLANPDFDNGLTDWVIQNGSGTVENYDGRTNTARIDDSGSWTIIKQAVRVVFGAHYEYSGYIHSRGTIPNVSADIYHNNLESSSIASVGNERYTQTLANAWEAFSVPVRTTRNFLTVAATTTGALSGSVDSLSLKRTWPIEDTIPSGNLVRNGDFSDGLNDWFFQRGSGAIVDYDGKTDILHLIDGGDYTKAKQTVFTVPGKLYKLSMYRHNTNISNNAVVTLYFTDLANSTVVRAGDLFDESSEGFSGDHAQDVSWSYYELEFVASSWFTCLCLGSSGANSAYFSDVNLLGQRVPSKQIWRIDVQDNINGATHTSIGAVELRTVASGADKAIRGNAFASGEYSETYSAYKAFDDDSATFWSNTNGVVAGWLAVRLEAPAEVVELALTCRPTSNLDQMVKDFTLSYWNGYEYVVALTVTGETAWTSLETRTYTLP